MGHLLTLAIPSKGFLDFWKTCECDVDILLSEAEDLVNDDGSHFSRLQCCIVVLIQYYILHCWSVFSWVEHGHVGRLYDKASHACV